MSPAGMIPVVLMLIVMSILGLPHVIPGVYCDPGHPQMYLTKITNVPHTTTHKYTSHSSQNVPHTTTHKCTSHSSQMYLILLLINVPHKAHKCTSYYYS